MALTRLALQNLNYTIREFYDRDGSPEYREKWDLDAPYQRGLVWSLEQKRNLIRSLLLGVPVGVIFANRRRYFDRECPYVYARIVDGKQRITAIREFVAARFSVPANWFEGEDVLEAVVDDRGDWREVFYPGLSKRARLGFDGSTIACYESMLPTLEAEAELYLLVNFGGVPQTGDDRRRAAELHGWLS